MKRLSIIVVTMVFKTLAFAQSGTLDLTFADNGVFRFNPELSNDLVEGMAVNSEGKIVVLTGSDPGSPYYLTRLLPDGSLDPSFGTDGIQEVELEDALNNAFITIDDSDCIIIMVYSAYDYLGQDVVYRFLPVGTPDPHFNNGHPAESELESYHMALTTQPDRKIIIAGYISFFDFHEGIMRFNENGTKDTPFNQNAALALTALSSGNIFGIHLQNDGKIVISGTTDVNMFIARLEADGDIDHDFGNNGFYIVNDISGAEAGLSVAIMPDESIIVSGESENSSESKLLCWKFQPDGHPDNTFGNNGMLVVDSAEKNYFGWFALPNADNSVNIGATRYNGINNDPILFHVFSDGTLDTNYGNNGQGGKTFSITNSIKISGAKTSDGKILLCGTEFSNGNHYTAISRFSEVGQPDSSFALNGTNTVIQIPGSYPVIYLTDLKQLPDDKILIAAQSSISLIRLKEDGSLDSSLNGAGYYVSLLDQYPIYSQLETDANGQYLVEMCDQKNYGAIDLVQNSGYQVLVQKFDTQSNPDSSYGINSIARIASDTISMGGITSSVLQPDGKLLIAGSVGWNIFVLRLNINGTIDSSFGSSGIQTFDWSQYDANPHLALRSDGRIMIQSQYSNASLFHIHVSLLLPNGTPDTGYGSGGSVDFTMASSTCGAMALQSDDKMVLMTNSTSALFKFARLNVDGTIDSSFGTNGFYTFQTSSGGNAAMAIQQDGKKIISVHSNAGQSIVRFLEDGFFDESFGDGGTANFDPSAANGSSQSVFIQDDGKILVGSYVDFGIYVARVLNDVSTGEEPDIAMAQKLVAFPNPTTNQLIIKYPFSSSGPSTISIADIAGKILHEEKINDDSDYYTTSVKNLSAGIYLLTFKTGTESRSVKFVKE